MRIEPPADFARCVDVGLWECVLQTAVVTYRNDAGVSVSLVAAVHSADPKHYLEIGARLAAYDLVLYEGWREEPQEANNRPESEPALMRSLMDSSAVVGTMLDSFLGLRQVDQWDSVDYSPASFVNADMSYSEFARLCRERKEDLVQLGIGWRLLPSYLLSALIRVVSRSQDEICRLLAHPNDWYQAARCLYTREHVEMNNLLGAFNASREALSNVTIHARNMLVEEVLIGRIWAGAREVAIYYGAVHMPDFERRLQGLGFRKINVDWIDGWDVRRLE